MNNHRQAKKQPYPDRELIKNLEAKFLSQSVTEMSTREICDLINHQRELIHELEAKSTAQQTKENVSEVHNVFQQEYICEFKQDDPVYGLAELYIKLTDIAEKKLTEFFDTNFSDKERFNRIRTLWARKITLQIRDELFLMASNLGISQNDFRNTISAIDCKRFPKAEASVFRTDQVMKW